MRLKFKINPETGEPHKLMSSQMETLKTYCKEPRYPDWSEPGAGKTWPAACIALGAIEDGLIDHAIIVAPKVVLGDWIKVYKNIIDTDFRTNVVLYYAPKAILPHITLKPIIVTSYEMIVSDMERFLNLARTKRVAVIYDEAHKLKNYESGRTEKLTELAHLSTRCHLLSGTPLTNGMKNAFSYLNILWPGQYYNSWRIFKLRHLVYSKHNKHTIIAYKNSEEIEKIFSTRAVRYLKREIMDLPPITYKTVLLDWEPKQKAYYKKLMKEEIIELEDRFIEATDVGSRLVRFHQIITHPEQLGLMDAHSTRWTQIDDDLESIGVEDRKVVIFAHYRATIKKLVEKYKHYNPAVIFGGTTDVEEQKRKFNEDDSCRLFIAHPKSAGIGINLTVSSHVIFFEYTYDLDDFDQAVARVDRPGQRWPVTILMYAIRGSLEEKRIIPALIHKKKFSMAMLQDPEEFMKFISFDEDLEDMF